MDFNCDFNAPMFVDLLNQDMDTNPEEYFEIDHEAAAEARNMFEPAAEEKNTIEDPEKENPETVSSDSPSAETDEKKDSENSKETENQDQAPPKPVYSNLVSSWGTSSRVTRPGTPTRKALRQAVAETVALVANSPKRNNIPERVKQPKRLGTNLGNQPRLNNSKSETESATASNKSSSAASSPAVSRWKKAISQMTPEVIRQARAARLQKKLAAAGSNTNSTFDSSVASTFKDKMKVHRNLTATKSDASVPMKTAPVLPVVKPLHPTNPQPFKFATDARIKSNEAAKNVCSSGNVDFNKMLRSYKPSDSTSSMTNSTSSGPTQVKPFSFCNQPSLRGRARSVEASPSSNRFMSTAEMIKKFQTGTPDRFRSIPRGRSSSAGMSQRRRSPSPQLTQARTPNLMTRGRVRPKTVLSQEEREELELAEAKKNQVRAHAINEGVPPSKPTHVEKRPPTIPEPFNFSNIPSRGGKVAQPDEPSSEFHAKPAPKKILEKPVGIPEKQSIPLVVPQSPAFALKERLGDRRRPAPAEPSADDENNPDRVIRARPAPHFGVPVLMSNTSKRVTKAEPFSFYDRDMAMIEKKQQKLAEMEEEEKKAREFKAKPVPDLNKPVSLPIKEVLLPTRPEPFDFQIEKRVGERLQKWQENVEKELEEQKKAARFRARPAAVLEKEPFMPKPSDKPLAKIENFELHSDRRAKEREEYDMLRKQKEAELEAMKRQLEEKRQREEEEEVRRLRRELVRKAQPIKKYRSIEIHPSDKPLTKPVSPKFSSLSRSKKSLNSSNASSNSELSNEAGGNPVSRDQTFDL